MIRILISLVFFLYFSSNVYCQKATGRFNITGKVKVEQGLVDGTQIQVLRDGALLNNLTVNRTGNFRISVELNHSYLFKFINDGFYSKSIEVDTHIPPEVCDDNCVFPPYMLALMLYKKVPGVVEGNDEVGRVSYNSKIDNFDAELLRNATSLKNESEVLINEIKKQSIKYEENTEKIKKERYRIAISEADQLYQQKKYDKAMHRYRDAVLIFPEIQYARDRVNQLFKILVAEQMENSIGPLNDEHFLKYLNYGDLKFKEREYTVAIVAYDKALKLKPDDSGVKSKIIKTDFELNELQKLALKEVAHFKTVYLARTKKYEELVQLGDEKFKEEDIANANEYYANAVTQIDENSYALLMVKKIEELFSNNEAALKLAKEREEAEKKRLREARNKAYNDAIKEADKLLNDRLYRDAIEFYELALTIKSYEFYPQNQIRIIKGILAALQLKGEEYNRLLREGDQLLDNKNYTEARKVFVNAHALIEDEKYALRKIEEIDRILDQIKNEENYTAEYNLLITKADGLYKQKKYNEAIVEYQKASDLKPNEKYPKDQILKIRGILAQENNDQKRLLQLQIDFERIIVMADKSFNRESYQSARSLYQEALNIIPELEYPKSQIRKIDAILKERSLQKSTASKLDQIDFSNLKNVSAEDRKAAYNEAMEMGNAFMKTEEWGVAKFYFRRALALYPRDDTAASKLKDVDAEIFGENANEVRFADMVNKAEEAFKTGDFGVAKFYFIKAKEIKSNDENVNERIDIVTKLSESTATRVANREYDISMRKANDAMSQKNYSVARFFYRKALSLKKDDKIAEQKLNEVEALIK